MEFSEQYQYLTYEEYRALGGTLNIMPFNLLEFESRRQIDIRTQNRLKGTNVKDIPQEVKICVYKLINSISSYDETFANISQNGNVASENIDGYSVSYVNSAEIKNIIVSKISEFNNIIRECLLEVIFNGQHLLYRGTD